MTFEKVTEELAHGEHISIIHLVDSLIEHAELSCASDIHIDPCASSIRIRFRIDGVLHDMYHVPSAILPEIVSRIKVLSRLRTDEHYATQDGRFRFLLPQTDSSIDIRVSIIPTYHGENAVLRLLSDKAENFSLQSLGFSISDAQKIMHALGKPSGMILATGPTGSGKTTTLYSLLKMLNTKEVSIVSIEDPIEYAIDGVKQIQVRSKTGLTFANGLRSVLRQDPNIIMVGEIRDSETAHIAVNTALTGHLLLSTLHTSDAATTLPRLLDMGIESFLVASTVSIAIGQRLIRKLCTHCKIPLTPQNFQKEKILFNKYSLSFLGAFCQGKGCDVCAQSGYFGRMSINEVLVVDEAIRQAIVNKVSAYDIKMMAMERGMTTMFQDGIDKVRQGITSIEEVLRVIHE